MAYERKTEDEFRLLYDYGFGDGPELLTTELSMKNAKKRQQEYIQNEGIFPKIVRKRVLKKRCGNEV